MAECKPLDKTNFLIFHPYNKPLKQNVTIKINKKAISQKALYQLFRSISGLFYELEIPNLQFNEKDIKRRWNHV